MTQTTYQPGEIIFKEGERSKAAYFIESGQVEIRKLGQSKDVWIAVVGEGEVFGEMGLVEERPRSATARAKTEVIVRAVPYHEFVDMLVNHPRESISYIKRLMERLRVVSARLAQFQSAEASEELPETTRGSYRVKLFARSLQAEHAISRDGFEVKNFPFRVGRASKHESNDPLQNNHLKLLDSAPYNVSRNHFAINLTGEGVELEDRGSYLGTIVNGDVVGGGRGRASTALSVGENHVVPGNPNSPFQFSIMIEHEL